MPRKLAPDRITQREFARRRGVSDQSVSEWVLKGIIKLDANGRLDPDQALEAITAVQDPARPQKIAKFLDETKNDEATDVPYHVAKTRRELALAQLAELDLAERELRLIPLAHLEVGLANVARQIAGALDAIPAALRRRGSISSHDLDYIAGEVNRARGIAATINTETIFRDEQHDTGDQT